MLSLLQLQKYNFMLDISNPAFLATVQKEVPLRGFDTVNFKGVPSFTPNSWRSFGTINTPLAPPDGYISLALSDSPTVSTTNSKPVMQRTAAQLTRVMRCADSISIPQPFTIFIVHSTNSNATRLHLTSQDDGVSFGMLNSGGGLFRINAGVNLQASFISFGLKIYHVFALVFNGSSSAIYANNQLIASGNAGANPLVSLQLGAPWIPTNGATVYTPHISIWDGLFNTEPMTISLASRFGIEL